MIVTTTWFARGLADGCESVTEIIEALQREVQRLERMLADGVTLDGAVEEDEGTLVAPSEKVAERYGFEDSDE